MTRHTFAVLLTICAVALACAQQVIAQKRQRAAVAQRGAIQEVKTKSVTVAAPAECLLAFEEFFLYLQKADANIVRDEVAQKRWLTQELRKALAQKVATFASPADDPDYPSNATFVGSWDYPSTYSIAASRRYGQRAVIDVLYKWDQTRTIPAMSAPALSSFVTKTAPGSSTTFILSEVLLFRRKV